MNPLDFVRTIYLGDRGCKAITLDGWNGCVRITVDTISRVRSASGQWDYYTAEDVVDGVLVFGGVTFVDLENDGSLPNDFIDFVDAKPCGEGVEVVLCIGSAASDAVSRGTTLTLRCKTIHIEDPLPSGRRDLYVGDTGGRHVDGDGGIPRRPAGAASHYSAGRRVPSTPSWWSLWPRCVAGATRDPGLRQRHLGISCTGPRDQLYRSSQEGVRRMTRRRRTRRVVGDVVSIPLDDGARVGFGLVLEDPLMAFFDLSTNTGQEPDVSEVVRSPVAFRIWVMRQPIVDGLWPVLGRVEVPAELAVAPWFFKQDLISGKITITRTGSEKVVPAPGQAERLERAQVYSACHVVDRLQDHFAGRPNRWA